MALLMAAEIASRLPVISADAMAPSSPGSTLRMRWSIVLRMPSIVAAARSRSPWCGRRFSGPDTAEHKTRGADALEIKVAREVVAARP